MGFPIFLFWKKLPTGKNHHGDVAGWGQAGKFDPPEPIAATVEHVLARRIIGKSGRPTVLSEELYAFSRDFGQRGTFVQAISGIDVPLWDLLGKKLGEGVCCRMPIQT